MEFIAIWGIAVLAFFGITIQDVLSDILIELRKLNGDDNG